MNRKLTKEEAVKLFRQMWTDMQKELGDCPDVTERLDFKKEWCDKNLPDVYVQNYCPLCEYVEGLRRRIDSPTCRFYCPIDWPGGNCFNMNYVNYYEDPISVILALPEREVSISVILALPEREVSDEDRLQNNKSSDEKGARDDTNKTV